MNSLVFEKNGVKYPIPQTKLNSALWFPSAKQRRDLCSGTQPVNQDLRTSHDWPVKKPKCQFVNQAPVVQTLDSAIHRINHYPADKY